MDAVLLTRIQFAANISFHILFPAITIAVLLPVPLATALRFFVVERALRTAILLPAILGYTTYAYPVFWGKTRALTYG